MESLLTLSAVDFRAVDLALRLTVVLPAMAALLMALSASLLPPARRLALCVAAVTLGGGAWFEAGVWHGWRTAFELAGSSYCVTGHPLAGEDRIIAWALGVPGILLAFALVSPPKGMAGGSLFGRLALVLGALALLAPLSKLVALALFGYAGWMLCFRRDATSPLLRATRWAAGSMALGLLITLAGSWRLLPLGRSADSILVRGELILALCDTLSLVVPSVILLTALLGDVTKGQEPAAITADSPTVRERRPKARGAAAEDPQAGLF